MAFEMWGIHRGRTCDSGSFYPYHRKLKRIEAGRTGEAETLFLLDPVTFTLNANIEEGHADGEQC